MFVFSKSPLMTWYSSQSLVNLARRGPGMERNGSEMTWYDMISRGRTTNRSRIALVSVSSDIMKLAWSDCSTVMVAM